MNRKLSILLIAVPFAVSCSSLKPISKYASKSAKVTALSSVAHAWKTSHETRKTLIHQSLWTSPPEKLIKQLTGIQEVLKGYFETMDKLAGLDKTASSDDLKGTVKLLGDAGALSASQQKLANTVVVAISEAVTDYRRREELQKMIIKADPPIQSLISDLVEMIEKDLSNAITQEIESLNSMIESKEPEIDSLVFSLERTHLISKLSEAKARLLSGKAYAKALRAVAAGHKEIAASVDDLTSIGLKARLAEILAVVRSAESEMRD